MRLLVIAAAVAAASSVLAQGPVEPAPVQNSTVLPRTPPQRQGFRQPGAAPTATPGSTKAANVPPDTPVVTMEGVCQDKQAKSPCKTVVTREDLDRFIGASAPDTSPAARSRAAIQYARTVAFSALAEQQGLDKNPVLAKELELQLKLLRMRILSTAFVQNLEQQSTTVLGSEVERYYELHRDQYEQAQVRRVAIPVTVPTATGRPLDRAAIKAEMDELRNRAVAGEDLNVLLQRAFEHLQIQAPPPPVNAVSVRRNSLQGDEAKAFDLNPGEITPVLDLPAAFAIIKLDSKEPIPIDSLRQEIEGALRRDVVQNQISKLGKRVSTEFNLQYLELPSQPDIFGPAAVNPLPPRPVRARTKAQQPVAR
jgi:PPIC-type PPIASE domain